MPSPHLISDTARIRRSIGWLNFDRGLRIGIGLVQVAIVARYLGADLYGRLSTALAISAILAGPAALGLDTVMVRWLVASPMFGGAGLVTAVYLRVAAGCLAALGAAGAALFIGGGTQSVMVAIAALTCIAQAPLVLETWFRSRVLASPPILAQLIGFLAAFAVRLGLVYLRAPVYFFAAVAVLEIGVSAGAMFRVYLHHGGPALQSPSRAIALELVREAWPLAVGSIAAAFMTKIDLIILQRILGTREAGLYAAAVRIVELPFFVPATVVAAFTPQLMNLHAKDQAGFYQKFSGLVSLLAWSGAGIASGWCLLGPFLIRMVYGAKFVEAELVLRVYAWTTVPVSVAVVWGAFWLAKRRQLTVVLLALFGATVALCLCYVLIPLFGARGAALSAIAAQVAPFIVIAFLPSCRGALRASARGMLNPILGFRLLRELLPSNR
jgi:PST family polysaccharide transporter